MILLYFLPMITVILFLIYFIKSDDFRVTNGVVLLLSIASFLPLFNIVACFVCFIIWSVESQWFNRPFGEK